MTGHRAVTGRPVSVDRIGRMSLTLPGTSVKPSQGAMAYQVRNKTFAMVMHDHHGNGRTELWVKGAPGAQAGWVADGAPGYFVPPYVGPNGWIGAWLDVVVDWPAVAELLVDGYLTQAGAKASAGFEPATLLAAALGAG